MQNYGFRHEFLCKFLSFCPFLTMKKVLICPFSNYFLLSFLCTDPCTYTANYYIMPPANFDIPIRVTNKDSLPDMMGLFFPESCDLMMAARVVMPSSPEGACSIRKKSLDPNQRPQEPLFATLELAPDNIIHHRHWSVS